MGIFHPLYRFLLYILHENFRFHSDFANGFVENNKNYGTKLFGVASNMLTKKSEENIIVIYCIKTLSKTIKWMKMYKCGMCMCVCGSVKPFFFETINTLLKIYFRLFLFPHSLLLSVICTIL